ncbi:uncharacterized protein LOC135469757 [Liolophura sinensis]|uniref:uncharacterized protein LOC135469757 n=1 Tax=Liolophura sinensis TaxID=3198878 RepID=UPI0031581F94
MDTTTQSDIQDLVFGILTDTVALQPKFIAACFDVEPHQPVSPTVLSADRADNITVDNAKKFSKDEQSRNKTKVQSVTADLPAKESETKRAEKKASKKSRFRRFLSNVFGCCVCGRRSH